MHSRILNIINTINRTFALHMTVDLNPTEVVGSRSRTLASSVKRNLILQSRKPLLSYSGNNIIKGLVLLYS